MSCLPPPHATLLPPSTAPLAPLRSVNARRKEEEEANAVEKRGHMGDFYRNLLRRWGLGVGRVDRGRHARLLPAGFEQGRKQLVGSSLNPVPGKLVGHEL